MKRDCPLRIWDPQPRVWGLDVAGEGIDPDEAVLYKRQGPVVFKPWTRRNLPTDQLADQVAFEYFQCKRDPKKYGKAPKKIFVDKGGVGNGVHTRLRTLIGIDVVVGVDFGESALEDDLYFNRRTEMYCNAAVWVRDVGCLPEIPELRRDLTAPNIGTESTTSKGTRRSLESKKQMRARGLPSPDHGDGLALTFAMPVEPDMSPEGEVAHAQQKFDAFARLGGRG